jgi:hypothetical protein
MYRSMVYDAQIAAQASSIPDFAQQAGNLAAYSLMSDGHTVAEGEAAILAEVARFRTIQPFVELMGGERAFLEAVLGRIDFFAQPHEP